MRLRSYLVVMVCGSVPAVTALSLLHELEPPFGFPTAADSCATIEAPLQLRIDASAGGDLMPPGSLRGGIRFRASMGEKLPQGLAVDSAWLHAGGRVVAFRVHPWTMDEASSGKTVAFVFRESSEYFGPHGAEWVQSLEGLTGALRFRVVWGRDTVYVKASDCVLRFSM